MPLLRRFAPIRPSPSPSERTPTWRFFCSPPGSASSGASTQKSPSSSPSGSGALGVVGGHATLLECLPPEELEELRWQAFSELAVLRTPEGLPLHQRARPHRRKAVAGPLAGMTHSARVQ